MEDEETEVDMNRIVEITPIRKRFWTRIDGNLDLGFSYTKGSDVKQWNSSFYVEYRVTKSLTTLSGNSIYTEQPERTATSKQDFGLAYKRFIDGNWAYTGFGGLQQNTELGIDLRSSVGFGMSKNWLRSNLQRFISTAGVIFNQERGSNGEEKSKNVEGIIRLE